MESLNDGVIHPDMSEAEDPQEEGERLQARK